MSNFDQILPERFGSLARPAERQIIHRTLLCVSAGALEGAAATAIIYLVALVYHLTVLRETLPEFSSLFYATCGLFTGIVYGTSSAISWGWFLDRSERSQSTLRASFYAWTAALALTLLLAFLLGRIGDLSRVSLTSGYLVGIPILLAMRARAQTVIGNRIERGELVFETVSVIGNRIDVLNFLLDGQLWRQGHKLTGTLFFEDARTESGALRQDALSGFAADSLRRGTNHIIFVGSLADLDELENIASELRRFALNLLYAPATRNRSLKFLDVVAIGPNNVLRFMRPPISHYSVLLKRCFDIVLSAFGLALLSPLLLAVLIAIRIDSPGPIIYRQARRGFNGEPFMIWKFRSMTVTESGYSMRQAEQNDARITRVGAFLRRTSIDELPQLVNVLLGQMSLVGPRPHAISHDEQLSRQVARYAHRQRIKPGITGWAQVNGFRGETSSHSQIEGRVAHDIHYIDNWSIFLDLWILFLTVASPSARRNAR
ncbi:MAG: exopolysaccharide biosynthesis polyprenyl glycosylphosphotransferase [Devosia sp.]|nr:exopolysaccharide biosynthesis polyprenyl glycosylphosphotransferase [Devosia sp.]